MFKNTLKAMRLKKSGLCATHLKTQTNVHNISACGFVLVGIKVIIIIYRSF